MDTSNYKMINYTTKIEKENVYSRKCLLLDSAIVLSPGRSCHSSERAGKYNNMDQVKVAAVQISGYDKTVIPGLEIDMVGKAVPYIERAARDSAHLVVFPEYCLGRIEIPGKETKALSNPIP